MNQNEIIKFEAETYRMLAFITGTPAGALIIDSIRGDIDINIWLLYKISLAMYCWLGCKFYLRKTTATITKGAGLC